MANRLMHIDVTEVAAVAKGANRRRWFLRKGDEGQIDEETLVERLVQAVKKALGFEGRKEEEEDMGFSLEDVKKTVTDAVTEAIKPIEERVDELEKAGTLEEPAPPAAEDEPSVSDIVKTALQEALTPLSERIQKLEDAAGQRRSDGTAEPNAEVKKSLFAGIF